MRSEGADACGVVVAFGCGTFVCECLGVGALLVVGDMGFVVQIVRGTVSAVGACDRCHVHTGFDGGSCYRISLLCSQYLLPKTTTRYSPNIE